ncbi:carboxymuconolactone decarboxylase family protein [Metabacillus sp. GX 13764]|uniref:carboxymuconolactone decarboxylase family protein n=1 Tax=Metabacillus kandeliae TaxID=2900151 RepID=UPI001E328106|nr:carboxymuconolactone decarboxylase family protein [Metabacillus kandeliae]MCD7034129.1 carboxymuconolactone decarboxylase family protein [Metabacillus kandeliae]
MARINESAFGETPFQKLLGHNQEVMNAWNELGDVLGKDGHLSAHLKEQVRRTLAQGTGCEFCKAKGKPEPHLFDEKMSIAAGIAEVFTKQKGDIPEAVFHVLKEELTDEEISELIAFVTFTAASQYFGAIMAIKPAEAVS